MNHGHHQHSVQTSPGGGVTSTTVTPVVDPGVTDIVPAPAPSPTTVVVTTPAAAPAQNVSMGAMVMIAFGALLAGGAVVYFWPELVGQAEKVKADLGASENPLPRRRKRKAKR